MRETTALGAAIAAGFASGVYKTFDELKSINMDGRYYFKPEISAEKSKKMYGRWSKAVEMSRGWVDDDDDDDEDQKDEEQEVKEDGGDKGTKL